MLNRLKWMAGKLPHHQQQALKRAYFARQIGRKEFLTDEQEFAMLESWVSPGDMVLDLGANIGHYTARLSELVGAAGRVVSFEPVIDTFELLCSNVAKLPCANVTLLNAAASDQTGLVGLSAPSFEAGMTNYYQASISQGASDHKAMALTVDGLALAGPVTFVKIDVEGHELQALTGMSRLLERDHPVVVAEGMEPDVEAFMAARGYRFTELPGSSNRIYELNRV